MPANAILVINAGSSSIKFSVFTFAENSIDLLFSARAVRLFQKDAEITIFDKDKNILHAQALLQITKDSVTHADALQFFLDWIGQEPSITLQAVGHRIVHGGPKYNAPVLLNDDVYQELMGYQSLAPLHQVNNLAPVKAVQKIYPNLQQLACFDTAFHQSMPRSSKMFALPNEYYEKGIRRYGFHGLSYEYIISELQQETESNHKKIIIAHLGNGASMCAIRNNKSIATTMSFTPLDGLIMGTRCGDLDPGVILHLFNEFSLSADEISDLLYKQSGLLGLSQKNNNMRKLLENNDQNSRLAVELFCCQVNRHLGMLVAELGGLDQLIFTAGIGENSAIIREKICELASWSGIKIDKQVNNSNKQRIDSSASRVEVLRMHTDEALMIARHVRHFSANTLVN